MRYTRFSEKFKNCILCMQREVTSLLVGLLYTYIIDSPGTCKNSIDTSPSNIFGLKNFLRKKSIIKTFPKTLRQSFANKFLKWRYLDVSCIWRWGLLEKVTNSTNVYLNNNNYNTIRNICKNHQKTLNFIVINATRTIKYTNWPRKKKNFIKW